MTRMVQVPYILEQDEDGFWCANAELRPGSAAFGYGDTAQDALDDLREGLALLLEEAGPPEVMTLTVTVT